MPRVTVGERMVKDCLEYFHIVSHELKNVYNHIGTYKFDKIYSPLVNLRPDFVISLNVKGKKVVIFVEFDGEQHYYPVGFGGERDYNVVLKNFKQCLANDERKNKYWNDNKLPYLRISYQHRQKDSVMFHIKEFLIKNNCHEATPVLKGSDPESILYHCQIHDEEQQRQRMINFKTAIKEAYEVEVFPPPRLKHLPPTGFFFEFDDWPEGYGPRERNNSSNRTRKTNDDSWYELFEQLEEYEKDHGDCDVPRHYPENQSLAYWVIRQRAQYRLKKRGKASHITDYRIRTLEEVGFKWKLGKTKEDLWYKRFEQLHEYQKQKGDCNVPENYPDNQPLATWVKTQRKQYRLKKIGKASCITADRISTLEEIGFQFNLSEDLWNEKLEQLQVYVKEHGHCNVPRYYPDNQPFATWVGTQCDQYSRWKRGETSTMSEYRRQKLDELGFWRSRAYTPVRYMILSKL